MKFSLTMDVGAIPKRKRASGLVIAPLPRYVMIFTLAPGAQILGAYISDIATAEKIVDDLKAAISLARGAGLN